MSRKRFLFVLFLIFTLVMLILINYRIADRSIPVEVISYTDASKYFMHIKTVEMPINFVFDTKKYIFISSRSNPHRSFLVEDGNDKSGFFTVRIYNKDLGKFSANFVDSLYGKKIKVTGQIIYYQGDPHIVVSNPEQIEFIQ